jgi:hypothetical protein
MNWAQHLLLAAGLVILIGCVAAFFNIAPANIDLLFAGSIAGGAIIVGRWPGRRHAATGSILRSMILLKAGSRRARD